MRPRPVYLTMASGLSFFLGNIISDRHELADPRQGASAEKPKPPRSIGGMDPTATIEWGCLNGLRQRFRPTSLLRVIYLLSK